MSELPDAAPACVHDEGSRRLVLSGLNHTTFDLTVYASQGGSPHHHASLASGCWSSFARRDSYPQGFSERFQSSSLFSHITINWRGRPLVSYQVIVNLIGATTTQAGLRVQADLDTDFYPTKVKVTDKQLATVDLHPHRFHGKWNYTIKHQIISV